MPSLRSRLCAAERQSATPEAAGAALAAARARICTWTPEETRATYGALTADSCAEDTREQHAHLTTDELARQYRALLARP